MGEQFKTFTGVQIKSEAKGEISCVFATLNTRDHDGDVTLPGAFEEGAEVAISQYGHTIWSGTPPIGKGTIRTNGNDAIFEGQLFMEMAAARETFYAIKGMGEKGEWSYGFETLEVGFGEFEGEDVKFLKALKVFEVSPVLRGAGIGTRTTGAKGHSGDGRKAPVTILQAIPVHETGTSTKRFETFDLIGKGIDELRARHAWWDTGKSPLDPAAYFGEHHDADGKANMRQCLIGVARLNGAKGWPALNDAVRQGVYDHLVEHLRDGDRDAPELRKGSANGDLRFYEHLAVFLNDGRLLLDRAEEVMALRAKRRKSLSAASVDLLEWISEDYRRIKALVDTPQDDFAREYLRFQQDSFTREIETETDDNQE